jgi:hypothetical protein
VLRVLPNNGFTCHNIFVALTCLCRYSFNVQYSFHLRYLSLLGSYETLVVLIFVSFKIYFIVPAPIYFSLAPYFVCIYLEIKFFYLFYNMVTDCYLYYYYYKYYVSGRYPSSCFKYKQGRVSDRILCPKRCVLNRKKGRCFRINRTMDNVRKHNICINVPLSQTSKPYLLLLLFCLKR